MIGAAGNRPRLVDALSDFVRKTGIPFFSTQMGKGVVTSRSHSVSAPPRSRTATTFMTRSTAPI